MSASEDAAFRQALSQFLEGVSAVWDAYQEHGPGQVDESLFDAVPDAAAAVETYLARTAASDGSASAEALIAAVHTLVSLSRQCATSPQGLCFITGEAGLIPRRDQHEAFERALQLVARRVR